MTKRIAQMFLLLSLLALYAAGQETTAPDIDRMEIAVRTRIAEVQRLEADTKTPSETPALLRVRQSALLAAADYDVALAKNFRKIAADLTTTMQRATVGGENQGSATVRRAFLADSLHKVEEMARRSGVARSGLSDADALKGAAAALDDRLKTLDRGRQRLNAGLNDDWDAGIQRAEAFAAYFEVTSQLETALAGTYGSQASRRELLLSREATTRKVAEQIDELRSDEWRNSLRSIVPEMWWTSAKLADAASERKARVEAKILLDQAKRR
jgi:hypothetical protein